MSKLNFPKTYWIVFAIVGLLPILGLIAYPFMPETIGMHWSFGSSAPDGYGDKAISLVICFLLVFDVSLVSLIGIAIAQMEDQRAGKFFELFTLLLAMFSLYSYCLTLLWNVGLRFNYNIMIIGGLILFVAGTLSLIVKYWRPFKLRQREN